MSLSDPVGALEAPAAAIRRYALCYSIAAAAAIGALFYAASAATRALEMSLGPVEARAIMAVALALIAVCFWFAPRWLRSKSPAETARASFQAMSREEKIAVVLEALRFGFAMGSRNPPAETQASETQGGRK